MYQTQHYSYLRSSHLFVYLLPDKSRRRRPIMYLTSSRKTCRWTVTWFITITGY